MPGIAIFFFIFMGIYFICFCCLLVYKKYMSKDSKNKSPKPATLFEEQSNSYPATGTVYTVTTERIAKPLAPPNNSSQPRAIPQITHAAASGPVKKGHISSRDISSPIPIKGAPWITPATPYHTPNSGLPFPPEVQHNPHPSAPYAVEDLPAYNDVPVSYQKK